MKCAFSLDKQECSKEASCFFFEVPMCEEHVKPMTEFFDLSYDITSGKYTCKHCGQIIKDRIHLCFEK